MEYLWSLLALNGAGDWDCRQPLRNKISLRTTVSITDAVFIQSPHQLGVFSFFCFCLSHSLTLRFQTEPENTRNEKANCLFVLSAKRSKPKDTLCTPLYSSPSTIDIATRTARILTRRMQIPVYVGCSADFSGSTADEETAGLTKIVDTIMGKWEESRKG